jgi:hypothetical protein
MLGLTNEGFKKMETNDKPKFTERFYATTVELAVVPGGAGTLAAGIRGEGSITLQNRPFLAKRMRTAIVGPNQIVGGLTDIQDIFQDGQYLLTFKTQSRNFMNQPILVAGMFQDVTGQRGGDFIAPIPMDPKDVIEIEITNAILRQAGINIQVVFEGVEPLDIVENPKA